MRTAAIILGIVGACLIFAMGFFVWATSFGTLERKIPDFWQFVFLATFLALAGGIATWWRAALGSALMAASVLAWVMLDVRMLQAMNLFGSARGTISAIVLLLTPPLLLGLAIYLALKSHRASAQNPS